MHFLLNLNSSKTKGRYSRCLTCYGLTVRGKDEYRPICLLGSKQNFVVALSENKPPLGVVELKNFRYKYSPLWYNENGPPTKIRITRGNSQND